MKTILELLSVVVTCFLIQFIFEWIKSRKNAAKAVINADNNTSDNNISFTELTASDNSVVNNITEISSVTDVSEAADITEEPSKEDGQAQVNNTPIAKPATSVDPEYRNQVENLKRKLEFGKRELYNNDEEIEIVSDVASLISHYTEVEINTVEGMNIVADNEIESFSSVKDILSYKIRNAVIKEDNSYKNNALISVRFTDGFFNIMLERATGSNERSHYYKMTINKSAQSDSFSSDVYSPRGFATLLEFRTSTEKEDMWEVKYMLEDALDKRKSGNVRELTDEQITLLDYAGLSLDWDIYMGKKYYNSKCYSQALGYFLRIFKLYKSNFQTLDDKLKKGIYNIAYYIGHIYMEFGEYEKAYYYLNLAKEDSTVPVLMEYVNCLSEMKDVNAYNVILSELDKVCKQMEKDPAEHLLLYHNYLKRRAVYVMIDIKKYTQAEDMLNKMMEEEENKDFALSELSYLQNIKTMNSKA